MENNSLYLQTTLSRAGPNADALHSLSNEQQPLSSNSPIKGFTKSRAIVQRKAAIIFQLSHQELDQMQVYSLSNVQKPS
jgi:hypothetical protein